MIGVKKGLWGLGVYRGRRRELTKHCNSNRRTGEGSPGGLAVLQVRRGKIARVSEAQTGWGLGSSLV